MSLYSQLTEKFSKAQKFGANNSVWTCTMSKFWLWTVNSWDVSFRENYPLTQVLFPLLPITIRSWENLKYDVNSAVMTIDPFVPLVIKMDTLEDIIAASLSHSSHSDIFLFKVSSTIWMLMPSSVVKEVYAIIKGYEDII